MSEGSSHDGPDDSRTHLSSIGPDMQSFQRILCMMRELQGRVRQDRKTIADGVGQQLRNARIDQYRITQSQDDLHKKMRLLLGRLNAVGGPEASALSLKVNANIPSTASPKSFRAENFSMETPPAKLASGSVAARLGVGGSVDEQLRMLHESIEKSSEEAELLKLAVFNDRVVREERQGAQDEEDAVIEERIRQAEAANDSMRNELQTLRSTMHRTVEMLEAIHQHEVKREMPPQFDEYELDRLVIEVQSTVERVRAEHAALQGRLESVEQFAVSEESKRREKLASVGEALQRLEEAQRKSADAKKHLPFLPNVSDVSADWLKDANSRAVAAPLAVGDAVNPPASHRGLGAIDSLTKTMHELDADLRPSPAAASGTASSLLHRQDLEELLRRFYAIYNPQKCDDVERILNEYEGAEEELFAALEVHYGCFGYFSQ